MDALVAIIDKALGYPRKAVHVGGGIHADIQETWDGQGPTPPGWTKSATAVWVASAADAAAPLPDEMATELQRGAAQARLTGPERAALATAIAGRAQVDLGTRVAKNSIAAGKVSND